MQQRFDQPTEAEQHWIAKQLETASEFVEDYSPADTGQRLAVASLDRAFAVWQATNETDPQVINGVINCVGIAFGQFLVNELQLRWVIATDEHGTDLAVHGLPGKGDVLVYPANFVAKRWERKESNFLADSIIAIELQLEEIAALHSSKNAATPWWKFW